MGMYDTMANDEQVKCFYFVGFWKDSLIAEKNNGFGITTHIGGELRYFPLNSKVPIKTEYYIYPENFCIYDYRDYDDFFPYPNGYVHVIRNGIYEEYVKTDKIKPEHIMPYWIDNYGRQINIKSPEDVIAIRKDFLKHINMRNEIIAKYNTMKLLNKARDNMENPKKLNEILAEYDAKHELEKKELESINIMNKWFIKDLYENEKQFGEFLSAYKQSNNFSEHIHDSYREQMDCKEAFKYFLDNRPGIVDRYIKWQELDEKEIKDLLKIVEEINS